MTLKIYNTLNNKKEEFIPIKDGEVKMYVCGPTVYDLSHIGHARSAVSFDVVFRHLKRLGYKVTYTRNYTDVDDKIINRANKEGVQSIEIANRFILAFDKDMADLGVELPTHRPRATETIEEMIALIEKLTDKGFAYSAGGDVFFRVRAFKEYGKLSGKNIDDLESGARVEVDGKKEDPLDFALWKSSKPGEPAWDSPFGSGRPGWHIECSAMCLQLLGESFDIHGGGKDLIFPHHENEIAQSEAATGKPFARYWLHNGFVNIEKEKMSKSLGNILNIRDALKDYSPECIRLFLLSSHYRSPIEYGPGTLKEAEAKAERFYRTIERIKKEVPSAFTTAPDKELLRDATAAITAALNNDFNTAEVIGLVFKKIAEANRILDSNKADAKKDLTIILGFFKEAGAVLGLFQKEPEDYFKLLKGRVSLSEEEIERLIQERNTAREEKNFKRADEVRDELKEKGIILEDTPEGTKWTVS
ncbi:MAG: cysteine--tRNA ligase [Deltaproteobacteria bacterium]|nr:cysteine--tRNA ligase [Deltaproteobacteria bacterium]